jgi:VanZ family protein
MKDSHGEPRGWISRRGYATFAIAVALFIVYGSLVPLVFRSVSFDDAVHEFADALSGTLIVDSRTDFVTNILLTIPLAYFTCAAFMTDRRGYLRRSVAVFLTLALCSILSVGVEFAQVFSRGRTDSLSDIVAQEAGSVVGVVMWLLVGNRVTGWLRESLRERRQPAMIQRILLAYCVVFAIAQVMPLDLTLSLGQLAQKYRRGMILLRPFAYHHPSTFDMWWDYLGDVVLNIPVGAAALLLWTKDRTRRGAFVAFAFGVAAVGLVEFAQVFVNSRFADSTDLLTGSLGVMIGIALASAYRQEERTATQHSVAIGTTLIRVGIVVWIMALMSYHWNPFDFTTDPKRVTLGVQQILSVPFYSYYLGSEFHALTEMLRKFLLAAPLGSLLRLSWSSPTGPGLAARVKFSATATLGFAVLVMIEIGQIFLPTRTPDITDALIGEAGLVTAMWLTGRLIGLGFERGPVFDLTSVSAATTNASHARRPKTSRASSGNARS